MLLVGDAAYEPGVDLLRAYVELCNQPLPPIERDDTASDRFEKVVADRAADGLPNIWEPRVLARLSYCVSAEFGDKGEAVRNALAAAARDWQDTHIGVSFVHRREEDGRCHSLNTNVVFDVRPVEIHGLYARAFFPNQGREVRNLAVTPAAMALAGGLTLTGIMRHELGHILGLRHEYARQIDFGGCQREAGRWIPIGPADPSSVMHLPGCGGQTADLRLTPEDRRGIQCVYRRCLSLDSRTLKEKPEKNAAGARVADSTRLSLTEGVAEQQIAMPRGASEMVVSVAASGPVLLSVAAEPRAPAECLATSGLHIAARCRVDVLSSQAKHVRIEASPGVSSVELTTVFLSERRGSRR